jgi:hypothetical protein
MGDLRPNMTKGRGISKHLQHRKSACPHAGGTGQRQISRRQPIFDRPACEPDVSVPGVCLKKAADEIALAVMVALSVFAKASPRVETGARRRLRKN